VLSKADENGTDSDHRPEVKENNFKVIEFGFAVF
jgi:hypothetical protein